MEDYPISCNEAGVAMDGYDMVAYFRIGKPQKGLPQHASEYRKATWHFASEQHKQLFDAEPEKYMPQFGGYCAYAVAAGNTTKGAGKHGAMIDGKLYFSVNLLIKQRYLHKPENYNSQAENNWAEVQQKIRQGS